MTLRLRLTAALVVIVTIGLIVSSVATYAALRSFLLQRVDQQLGSSQGAAVHILAFPGQPGDDDQGPGAGPSLPEGTFVALFDPSGAKVGDRTLMYGGTQPAPPALSNDVRVAAGSRPHPFTVAAEGGGDPHYRVRTFPLSQGFTVAVAIPLTEVARTLRRLLGIAVLVTIAVLAAMALVSSWIVRRGLRPLEEIEVTAGAIAGGDLSLRVDRTDPRTEVGRLGSSLNVMLGRIEDAMNEQRASAEALRRFLADASHELRTPLTSIRGYAELFRRGAGADPADTALAMRRIEQEGERMGELVDDLLFLARSGDGRPISHEPVDLARLVTDAVLDARAVDPGREITLDAPPELEVSGDDRRLRQVAANLLSNARTHTPPGTPVTVRLSSVGGWATLEVSDAGPGIAPEDARHVFEPFYRADPARRRIRGDAERSEEQGTGLGLSIVAAIAEAHGGRAEVTSTPGEGATFTVRIPVAAPADPELPGPPPDSVEG